jgi:hypothetical protein
MAAEEGVGAIGAAAPPLHDRKSIGCRHKKEGRVPGRIESGCNCIARMRREHGQ